MDQRIIDLTSEIAASHQLPVPVVLAMVIVESSGDPKARRFEPAFFSRYIFGKPLSYVPAGSDIYVEEVHRAVSWGLLQPMGETARCLGFRGLFPELLAPDVGLEWGCRYLRRLADKYLADGGWTIVCRAYNGGPGNRADANNHYPDRVLSHIPGGVWPE